MRFTQHKATRAGIASCAAIILALSSLAAQAEGCSLGAEQELQRHTFRLVASGREDGSAIQQTAFRVRGQMGLITALHGVIGAKTIEATRRDAGHPNGEEFFGALTIEEIDRKADLARLMPADGVWGPNKDGLVYGGSVEDAVPGNPVRFAKLCVGGHPESTPMLLRSEAELRHNTVRLKELIGSKRDLTAFLTYLEASMSPHKERAVFSVDDPLRPGESGAPMVDEDGRVVAVANGGLRKGAVNLNWALPLAPTCFFAEGECEAGGANIEKVTREINRARSKFDLATKGSELFAESWLRLPLDVGAVVEGPEGHPFLGPHRKIRSQVVISRCDALEMTVEMENHDEIAGFCIQPVVTLVGENPDTDTVLRQNDFGRLCLGSVLEDEATLRLWELVESETENGPLRSLLRVNAMQSGQDRFAELKGARDHICERRKAQGIPCKPFRKSEQGQWTPPYFTNRIDGPRTIPIGDQFCEGSGGEGLESSLYEILIEYELQKKPDGIFEALDLLERGLKSVSSSVALICSIPGLAETLKARYGVAACGG